MGRPVGCRPRLKRDRQTVKGVGSTYTHGSEVNSSPCHWRRLCTNFTRHTRQLPEIPCGTRLLGTFRLLDT